MLLDEIEHRGVHALDRRGGRPQAQRDLFEFPALSEIGRDSLGTASVRIGIEQAAVLGGEKFASRQKVLLGQQTCHQSREGAAALVEFHRRRSPRREGAGRLAAGKAERFRHGVGVKPAQPADRCRGAKRPQHARAVPTFGAEGRVIDSKPDARRHLESGRERDHEVSARGTVAFGDGQSGRDHLRRHVGQRRAMDVAHGDRGDEITVQKCRAGKRQPVAANDAALVGLRQSRSQRRELLRLLATMPGNRTCQCVQQDVLAVIADLSRKIVVLQRRCKAGQHPGDVFRHRILPCAALMEIRRSCLAQSVHTHRS